MESKKQTLSVEEMANNLKCSVQYVRSLIRRGKIPAEQVGKTWVINPSILEDNTLMFEIIKDVPDQIRKTKETPEIVALSFFSVALGLSSDQMSATIPNPDCSISSSE